MGFSKAKCCTRRDFLRLGVAAAAAGPFFTFPERIRAKTRTLRIAKWAHFVPGYDAWFEETAKEWGRQQETDVQVDVVPVEQVWATAQSEAREGAGHDIFVFPWPPAEFQQKAIDHTEIYERASMQYGSIPQIAYKSTFNPRTKRHFAFADFWVPSPLHYFQDFWAEANMPIGPVHYGSLRSGGGRIRSKLGVPCGLALTPTLEGSVTSNTLFYAFRGQILDLAGAVTINTNAFTVEALKYVKALNQDAGCPEELSWPSKGNVRAMLARKSSCTSNAISLARAAEKENPEIAKKLRLQPPLLGPYGVTAFPHVTNCSVIWQSAKNQEGAKDFLVHLIDQSKTGFDKSLGCNFPTYPKTIPNLVVRLEKDAVADPPDRYAQLIDALHWTPNLGAPGFATPAWMETFNSFVIPKMFGGFVKGEMSAEEAARSAESKVKRIAEKWKGV